MTGLPAYVMQQGEGWPEELITTYSPLVKRIAHHLLGRLPDSVQVDDLIQAGMIGLLEAARNFSDNQGASFETYAGIRIRGAMLDEVRRNDWTPRSVYRKSRQVAEAIREVENREGREAREYEIAEQMGLSQEEFAQVLKDASSHKLLSLEDIGYGRDDGAWEQKPQSGQGVLGELQHDEFREQLAAEIGQLPERERLVMALYYDEELNLREIGAVIGVTESRVCQIHSRALLRLRARMGEWSDEAAC